MPLPLMTVISHSCQNCFSLAGCIMKAKEKASTLKGQQRRSLAYHWLDAETNRVGAVRSGGTIRLGDGVEWRSLGLQRCVGVRRPE